MLLFKRLFYLRTSEILLYIRVKFTSVASIETLKWISLCFNKKTLRKYIFILRFIVSYSWCYYYENKTISEESNIWILLTFFFKIYLLIREHEWGEEHRERDKQTSCWAWNLTQGSIPGPWDHNLSQNEEPAAQRTEPSRCPQILFKFLEDGHTSKSKIKIL